MLHLLYTCIHTYTYAGMFWQALPLPIVSDVIDAKKAPISTTYASLTKLQFSMENINYYVNNTLYQKFIF